MRVARIAEPGTGTGETRKRERVDEGARKDRVPKPMRAVERKVMKGEDMFASVCAAARVNSVDCNLQIVW